MLFFPEATADQAAGLLEGAGLAELQTPDIDPTIMWIASPHGPSGKPGMLGFWFDHEVAGAGAFRPDSQDWKLAPSERFWVGTHRAHPLRPENIERSGRPEMTLPVTLNDGNAWQIPVARYLPHIWGQDAAGEFTRTPEARFKWFCREAEEVARQFAEQAAGGHMTLQCEWEYICTALALSYRLTREIVSALALIGDLSGAKLLAATVELELIQHVAQQKKTA